MNPFWSSVYDRIKDRRYGSLFIFTLLIVIGFIIFLRTDLRQPVLLVMSIALVWWAMLRAISIWRFFSRKTGPGKYPKLSSDELRKARSKLTKNRNRSSV